jgi:hypothetical protein
MSKKQQFATAVARNGAQGAMAFGRTSTGNHVKPRRRDKWERQADETAHRILRGERNVARMLTPVAAASLTVPLSQGVPLPSTLRIEMEESFGADLADIRIHRDQHGAEAARLHHADAFTSGSNLFFGDGLWSPWSGCGRELIAHEIAHVLQQTGRRDSRGCLRATNVVGAGQVQCKDEEFVELAQKHDFFELNTAEVQSIAQGLKTDNSQPVVARREGTILTSPEEKPSDKSSVVPKQTADAGKTSVPQAKDENEFLPAVDEGALKESAAADAPVGKEIPDASATPEKAPTSPEEDAAYQAVVKQVEGKAKQEKTPFKKPKEKAQEVKLAAELPPDSLRKETGYNHHLQSMEEAPTPVVADFTVDSFTEKFRAKVNEIADKLPKAKDDEGAVSRAVAFGSEKAAAIEEVKAQNQNLSKSFRDEAARDPLELADKAVAAPELTVDPPGYAPEIKQARNAAAKPKTDQEISLDDESRALDDALRNQNAGGQLIDIDEGSLAFPISGEKTFDEAGETKRKAQEEIQEANPKYREAEKEVIAESEAEMPHIVKAGLKDQHQSRSTSFDNVLGTQESYKENIETEKGGVFKQLQDIYKETKGLVDEELAKVADIEKSFEAVLSDAEQKFRDYVHTDLEYIYTPGFFDYSDWKDVNAAEIDKEYERLKKEKGRQHQQSFGVFDYLKLEAMNNVRDRHAERLFNSQKEVFIGRVNNGVEEIAVTVVGALNEAKKHIREGEDKSRTLHDSLSETEQKEVDTVYRAVITQYQSLDETVGDRQREIIDDMARTYSNSVGKLRATFDGIKKDVLTGWLEKAWNKIKAVVNAIVEFATRIAELLGRIVYLLGDIISSPRAFFRNLVTGIGRGFSTFVSRIDEFLATAFFDWIRGTSGVQVQLPKEWNPAGIFSLFTQLLNLNTETIWQRMEVVYDKTVANAFRRGEVVLEKGLEVFDIIKKEGLAGLWDHIRESLGTLLSDTLDAIKETVLYAAIKKVILEIGKMLVPGGGFIAIAEKVIRLLEFIVEARNKILDLIESFVTSMENAVKGDIAGITKLITTGLTRFITVALDFLVDFFGLSSLKEKVERFIERMRMPVIRGIDWVLNKFKPIVMKGMEFLEKGKEKVIGVSKKVAGAVTGWVRRLLGVEKRFKGEDGSNHRLYFVEQASNAVLMINPNPAKGFESWVAHIEPDTSSEAGKRRAQRKAQAIAKAREIERVKAQRVSGNTDAEKKNSEEQKVSTIRGLIDELSALTGPLFTGERPDCAVEGAGLGFGGLWSGKYGTTMRARFLTNVKMPAGSVPAPPHLHSFEVINQRRNQGGSYYVKGHLLNHNLGGTGKVWQNLTPLTREANSAHERIAEARVKNAVDAGNIVYYAVQAKYGRSAPKGPNRIIQDIINEEVDVPKKLICEADLVTPAQVSSSGRETRTPLVPVGTEIENNISQKPADYDLIGIHETVYLDSGKVHAIAGIKGSDRRLAQKIVDAYDDKGSQFGSMVALAEYKFSNSNTFTKLQKDTILSFSDLGYVRLYERIT